MSIQASVLGVLDDKERTIETSDSVEEIENLMRELDDTSSQNDNTVYEIPNNEVIDNADEQKNDEDIGVYYFYVVKENDTYYSIANNYKVNEDNLREYNHNKELTKGNIIIIPYLL